MRERWFCFGCKREFESEGITVLDDRQWHQNWSPELGCPCCHGTHIEPILFQPSFIGGDIARDDQGMPIPVHAPTRPRTLSLPQAVSNPAQVYEPAVVAQTYERPQIDAWQLI